MLRTNDVVEQPKPLATRTKPPFIGLRLIVVSHDDGKTFYLRNAEEFYRDPIACAVARCEAGELFVPLPRECWSTAERPLVTVWLNRQAGLRVSAKLGIDSTFAAIVATHPDPDHILDRLINDVSPGRILDTRVVHVPPLIDMTNVDRSDDEDPERFEMVA